jgi:hypothetical protein
MLWSEHLTLYSGEWRRDAGHVTQSLFNIQLIHHLPISHSTVCPAPQPLFNIQSIHHMSIFHSAARPAPPAAAPLRPSHCSCSCSARPWPLLLPLLRVPAPPAVAPAPPLASPDDATRRHQRKEKHRALARKSSGHACCYDCGAPMLMVKEAAPGYDACFMCTF